MIEKSDEPKTQEQRSDRKLKIIIVILAILLLLTGGTMIFWGGVPFFSAFAPNNGGSTSQGTGLVVDPNASEYVPPVEETAMENPEDEVTEETNTTEGTTGAETEQE